MNPVISSALRLVSSVQNSAMAASFIPMFHSSRAFLSITQLRSVQVEPMPMPKPGPLMDPEVDPMQVSLLVVSGGPLTLGTFLIVCVPEYSMCCSMRCVDSPSIRFTLVTVPEWLMLWFCVVVPLASERTIDVVWPDSCWLTFCVVWPVRFWFTVEVPSLMFRFVLLVPPLSAWSRLCLVAVGGGALVKVMFVLLPLEPAVEDVLACAFEFAADCPPVLPTLDNELLPEFSVEALEPETAFWLATELELDPAVVFAPWASTPPARRKEMAAKISVFFTALSQ